MHPAKKYRKGHTAHQSCTAFLLSFLFIIMLQPLNHLIKSHGNNTEYNNRSNYHIQLEDLASINDQITKPSSCRQEFPDARPIFTFMVLRIIGMEPGSTTLKSVSLRFPPRV